MIKRVELEWLEFAVEVLHMSKADALSAKGLRPRKIFYSAWLSALAILMPDYCREPFDTRARIKVRDLFIEVKSFQDSVGDS
jgi:hypothetical protein